MTASGQRFGDAVTDLPFETIEIDLEMRARIERTTRGPMLISHAAAG